MLNKRLLFEIGLLDNFKKQNHNFARYKIIGDNPLEIEFELIVKDHNYIFKAVFNHFFPYQPITIYKITNFYTPHCYQDSAMCLKWGVDNWDSSITLTKLIINLIDLLNDENPLGEVHKKSEEGDIFSLEQLVRYRVGENDIILSNEIYNQAKINQKGSISFFKNTYNSREIYIAYKIDDTGLLDNILRTQETIPYIYIDLPRKLLFNNENIIKYIDFKANKLIYFTNDNNAVLLIHNDSFDIKNAYFSDYEISKRIDIDKSVLSKRITILGMGSIGSRLFVDLARAGFSNLFIVDNDLMLPHNVIRHELTNKDIGKLKVEALRSFVKSKINKKANISISKINILGQTSTTAVNSFIEKCCLSDIIIDCTANDNLLLLLDVPTTEKKIPIISGTVIPGGLGNIILYKNNRDSISMESILMSFYKWKDENDIFAERKDDYSATIDDQPFVATMSDCSILSGLLGKIAINILKKKDDGINNINIFSTSDYKSLSSFYRAYSIKAHSINTKELEYDTGIVELGRKLYENYHQKRSGK